MLIVHIITDASRLRFWAGAHEVILSQSFHMCLFAEKWGWQDTAELASNASRCVWKLSRRSRGREGFGNKAEDAVLKSEKELECCLAVAGVIFSLPSAHETEFPLREW